MALTKYKLGELITLCTGGNEDLRFDRSFVKGISIDKTFMETKADLTGISLANYTVVEPKCFSFVTVTSRNGNKISIAYNDSDESFLVSSFYVTFRLNGFGKTVLLEDYLYMFFNRNEFDRYARRDSWGSAREYFYFDNICDVEITLPSISIQQKYVDIYKAMIANQQSYERGLEDLRTTATACVEDTAKKYADCKSHRYLLGDVIEQRREKYDGTEMPIRGVSKDGFIEPKQPDADLHMYNQYYYGDFVFNPARMELNSIALNTFFEKACCSSLYEVFFVKRRDILMPEYLNLLLKRSEFARWCEYVGWGSAREYCRVDSISQYPIVIPPMEEQKAVVDLSKAYMLRKEINEQMKNQIKEICPILIKGSLEECRE